MKFSKSLAVKPLTHDPDLMEHGNFHSTSIMRVKIIVSTVNFCCTLSVISQACYELAPPLTPRQLEINYIKS